MLAAPVHTQSAPAPLVHTGSLQSVSALVCLLWIPSFAWVPIADQIRLDNSSLVFSHPACLCCLVRPTRHVHAHSHVHSPHLASPRLSHLRRILSSNAGHPNQKDLPTSLPHTYTAGQQLWICGRKDSHTLQHTPSTVQPLQTSLHPTQSQSPLQFAVAVSSSSISDRTLCLAPSKNPGPTTSPSASSRQFVLDAGPRRSLPCFLAFWDTAQVPLDLYTVDPDHCRPPIRPKKQEGRARKPHQGAALR